MKKKIAVASLLALMLISNTSMGKNENIKFDIKFIKGFKTCGQWVTGKTNDDFDYYTAQAWFVGFLSGIAIGKEKNILEGIDSDSILLWVDNFCRTYPLEDIGTAASMLYFELAKRKGY